MTFFCDCTSVFERTRVCPLHALVAIASHIVSAFRKYLKLTKAKANLKFTYVAKPTVFPILEGDLGPQT